jgi:hypothetical protein
MVIVRKSFFEAKVEHIVQGIIAREQGGGGEVPRVRTTPLSYTKKMMARLFPLHSSQPKPEPGYSRNPNENARLRPEMIRRVATQPPQLLDPNGKISWKSPSPELDRNLTSGSYTANDGARPFSAMESGTTVHGQYAILFS